MESLESFTFFHNIGRPPGLPVGSCPETPSSSVAMSRSIQEPESVTGSEILEAAGRDGDEMPDSAECESTPNFRELP